MIIDSGIVTGSLQVIGNTEITGSLKVTEGITGSLKGNSDTATSASHADQADIATNALTASYLSGYVSPFPFTGSAIVSGSLIITGSTASSQGFTGSLQGNADTATSASYAANSTTASYALASTSASHAISADSATSASYAANSTTASYAVNSTSSSYAVNSTSASHAASADNAISSSYALNATSAASAISASSVPYSGLTGTVPTWNQDTTGNASTATSSSYAANATSASYALSATTSSFAINADTVDGIHASAFVPNSATSSFATQTYVNTAVSNLVDSSPSTLDTLNELAAALGDDPNFATTVATSIGTKQAQLNGTGFVKISGTTVSYDNSTYTPTSRTLTINGTSFDLSADRSWSIASGVTSFNTRTGAITLSSGDVTTALGYTPYNATNPNGYISSYTETDPTVPSHVKSITTTNISNWNTAFGWGNHALAGYALANHTHIISPVAESSVSPNGISIQAGPGSSNPQGWSYPYGTKLSAITGAGRSFEIMSTTYPDGQLALRTLGSGGTWDSWKTILDSTNYNSYAPTKTGTGASGTWGISITGNADTVDGEHSNVFALHRGEGRNYIDYSRYVYNNGAYSGSGWVEPSDLGVRYASSSNNSNYLSILGGSGGNLNTMSYGRYYNYGSGAYWTNGPSGMSYGSVYNLGGSSESVLSLQLASDINHNSTSSTRTMWFRTGNNLGFQNDWKEILHSGNYNSYAPTLTGGGASGTWGIGISGNAGTITSQANSATINCSVGVTGNDIVRRDGNGYIYANHINFNTGESENPTINSFFTSNGDGWSRKSTLAHVKNSIRGVADGTWGINVTGNAAAATGLTTNYIGGQQLNPQTYFNNGVGLKVAMTAKVGVWSDTLWINGYSGGDVLQMCAMHFQRNGTPRSYISVQASTATSYGTAYEYVTEYNSPYALNMNQYVRTTDAPTFSELYTNGWFRNNDSNEGLYNQTTTQHWSSNTNGYWDASSTTSVSAIRFWTGGHVSSLRGYVYANNSNEIGFLNSAGNWSLRMDNSGNAVATGDVTAYSDSRVKGNVNTLQNALEKVTALRGVSYTRIDSDDKKTKIGVIAQEILEVVPEVVGQDSDGMYNVAYGNLAGLFIEAIKEQQTQIDELKELVKQLTNK